MIRPGQDLIMAGYAGLEGTRRIAAAREQELASRFSSAFLRSQLSGKEEEWGAWNRFVSEPDLKDLEREISAYQAVGEGGVLAALWNFSREGGFGIQFDLKKIPMKQITVEVCELFQLNPYRLLTSCAFVAAAYNGGRAARYLEQYGLKAAVIGRIIQGNARRMYHGGDEAGFLERPQPDEILKF